MSAGSIDGVYLSGWEYNRLLQDNPFTPRISALPAEILWNGAAHLWLFRDVWCSKESLDNEMAADEMMGWRTGRIFTELASRGILRPLDWSVDLNESTKTLLTRTHKALHGRFHHGADVRTAIQRRDMRTLEYMKIQLLEPIARSLGIIVGVTPNSIGLPAWKQRDQDDGSTPSQIEIRRFLAKVSAPVAKTGKGRDFTTIPSGIRVCERPGTGVDPADVKRQGDIQKSYEAPMISELLAGEGRFTGASGYMPYFEELMPHRQAYDAINNQLYANWHANRDHLLRLRSAAERNLWPHLHGEWLPELLDNPSSAVKLSRLVDRAIRRSEIGTLLTMKTNLIIGTVPPFVGMAVAGMLAEMAKVGDPKSIGAVAGASTLAVYAAIKQGLELRRDSAAEQKLALFYQQARKQASR